MAVVFRKLLDDLKQLEAIQICVSNYEETARRHHEDLQKKTREVQRIFNNLSNNSCFLHTQFLNSPTQLGMG